MSKSLIRKNQLHPDISDLVRDYGRAFFLDAQNLVATGTILQTQINNLDNTYATKISGQFSNRPTVNGTGIILSGDPLVAPNFNSTPSNPVIGQIYFDTNSNNFSGYNGTNWTRLNN
jgi:hypothetical protein